MYIHVFFFNLNYTKVFMYVIERECDVSEVNHHQTYTELKTIRLWLRQSTRAHLHRQTHSHV